jgi:hypothetical protein
MTDHLDLDLDIGNYSIKDIERFFQLKPRLKYSAADIEEKEYQILIEKKTKYALQG